MACVPARLKVVGSGSDEPLLQGPSVLCERGVHAALEVDAIHIDDDAVTSPGRHTRYVTYVT